MTESLNSCHETQPVLRSSESSECLGLEGNVDLLLRQESADGRRCQRPTPQLKGPSILFSIEYLLPGGKVFLRFASGERVEKGCAMQRDQIPKAVNEIA